MIRNFSKSSAKKYDQFESQCYHNFSDESISYSDFFEISEERLSQLIPNLEDRYIFVSRREVLYRKNSSILVSALLIVETMNIFLYFRDHILASPQLKGRTTRIHQHLIMIHLINNNHRVFRLRLEMRATCPQDSYVLKQLFEIKNICQFYHLILHSTIPIE